MILHPNSGRLREALQRSFALAGPWEGTVYRATTTEFANRRDLLSGAGSLISGGRWNYPGSFNAVYFCLEPETAMAEALANYRDAGIPVAQAMPLVFVAVDVHAQSILDLTSRAVQNELGVSARRLLTTPWRRFQLQGKEALTQAIGRLAWEARLEGMLVPSARRRGATNIVLFTSRRRRGSAWRIQRTRDLPRKSRD